MSTSGQPIVFGDDANIKVRLGMRLENNDECYNLQLQAHLYYGTLESREATVATTMSIEDGSVPFSTFRTLSSITAPSGDSETVRSMIKSAHAPIPQR